MVTLYFFVYAHSRSSLGSFRKPVPAFVFIGPYTDVLYTLLDYLGEVPTWSISDWLVGMGLY